MSYGQQNAPSLSATFVPGGFDDYYMPTQPELQAPLPQRHMPEVPDQMQQNLANLELEGSTPGQPTPEFQQQQSQPPQFQQQHTNPQQNPIQAYQQPGPLPTTQAVPQTSSSTYSQAAYGGELPHFSPFPKLYNPPPNVPPSDDEKEAVLENARVPVLNSNEPEMQLAWAADALAYVVAAQTYEERLAEHRPARPATPAAEHQLRIDAVSIVGFLADQHHPKAEFMKGMWLEFGNFGWRQDKREAFRSYARSAEKGYHRAEYRMGMQFEQNNDPVKALTHYQRGAAAGDSASNYRLGMMTLMGQMGQQQDFVKGVQMLQIAAEHADENAPQGAYVLGMLQARELPQVTVPESLLPYDEVTARQNIEKAAYLGFAKAQLKMGSAYELCSLGCDFDPALSMHYNALAARQGESEAEMAISKWFLCGYENVFLKNEELAYEYALRAAQSGLATAQFALGYFNEIGMHVPLNLEKANEWYDKAARNGNQDAKGRIEGLRKSSVLSKKDHENVAVNKIKSQHGSMRGKRPDRLRAQAPALPSVPDNEDYQHPGSVVSQRPSSSGRAGSIVPPRGSTTTPYPMNDGPPIITPQARPTSTAPYPLDNGPPSAGGPRPSFPGGFVPELRSHSAAPAQLRHPSGGAFNINPAIYSQGPGSDPYDRPQPGSGNMMSRPATAVSDTVAGAGRDGRGPNPRTASGPVGYGQRPPNDPYADPYGPPKPPSKLNVGYSGPAGGNNSGRPSPRPGQSPNNVRPQLGMNDIGYVAPLQPKKPVPVDGMPQSANRPPRGDSRVPSAGYQLQDQSRPSSQGQPIARPPRNDSAPTPKPASIPHAATAPQAPIQPVKKPVKADTDKPQPHPGMKPAGKLPGPGKGPKTFEDMGVPKHEDKSDCAVM